MSALSPQQIASVLRSAGFADQEIPEMTAIALAESGGRPNAHNPNAATGDNSYGLWQINMLGGMGPERLREFGISSNEQLFDPLTNARAAKRIRDSQGFGAWSVYKSGAYRQYLDQARSAAAGASVAVPSTPLAGGSLESGQPPRPRDDGDIFAGFAQRLLAGLTPGATGALAAPRASARPVSPAAPATGFRKAGGLPEELIAQIALGSDASERALALAAPPPVVAGGTPRRMAGSETFQARAETLGFSPARYMAGVLSGLFESRRQPTQAPPAIPPTAVPSAPGLGGFTRLDDVRTGNTGGSTGPHLDVRWADRQPIKPEDISSYLRVGGKRLEDFPVTSPYGERVHPIHGDRRLHAGFDLGTPENLDIEVAPGVQVVGKHWDPGGGGWVKTLGIPTANGIRRLQLLHLNA